MSRDLELLEKYSMSDSSLNGFKGFELLELAKNQHNYTPFSIVDIVDLDEIKIQVEEIISYLIVQKRFRKLRKLFNDKLEHYIHNGDRYFVVDGHQFQTLDEVEKCWNNRAFL